MKRIILLIFLLLFLAGCSTTDYTVVTTILDGNDVVYQGEDWTDSGCLIEATHRSDSSLSFSETIYTNQFSTEDAGIFSLQYTIDIEETTYQCIRNVVVIENQIPSVLLNPGIDTVFVGENHVDAGITATDNQDEDLFINVSSTVDTTEAGVYQITYTVTDLDGNQIVLSRMVTVKNPD
jgi:hypothetical protein